MHSASKRQNRNIFKKANLRQHMSNDFKKKATTDNPT